MELQSTGLIALKKEYSQNWPGGPKILIKRWTQMYNNGYKVITDNALPEEAIRIYKLNKHSHIDKTRK